MSEPLKVSFGDLFGVSTQKNEIIANMGWFEGNIWRWTLAWQRELLAEEVTQLQSLQDLLQQYHPVRDERDGVHWSSNRGFSVKNLMIEAEKCNNGAAVCDSIVGTVWKKSSTEGGVYALVDFTREIKHERYAGQERNVTTTRQLVRVLC